MRLYLSSFHAKITIGGRDIGPFFLVVLARATFGD